MNWIEEAKEKLNRFDEKKRLVVSAGNELAQLEANEELTAEQLSRCDYLRGVIRSAKWWVQYVHSGMAMLDEEERLVLERFYIYPRKGNLDLLCYELDRQKSVVYVRRDKALHHFTLAMFGVIET